MRPSVGRAIGGGFVGTLAITFMMYIVSPMIMGKPMDVAAKLGDAPSIVGKAEVDQINIISRWIHHHSDDRAFFPLQPALTDPHERRFLTQRIWVEIDAARAQPSILLVEDQEEDL